MYACIVIVCTDLSIKEPHRQVSMGWVVTSGSLSGVMSTLARNAIDVGSIPTLGAIFTIFITPMTLIAVTVILFQLHTVWLLNLPLVYICKITVFTYCIDTTYIHKVTRNTRRNDVPIITHSIPILANYDRSVVSMTTHIWNELENTARNIKSIEVYKNTHTYNKTIYPGTNGEFQHVNKLPIKNGNCRPGST